IHLRHYCSRHLYERYAAQKGRSRKSSEVANDAAAEREHCAGTVKPDLGHPIVEKLERRERFGGLTRRHRNYDGGETAFAKHVLDARGVKLFDGRVRHDGA